MRTHARAVVVGGGAVGAGIAYHLAKAGWTDTVLLERDELTSGSTWHAAGLLPLFNMGYATSHIHDYSVRLYKALEAETGLNAGFSVVGNLRMAGVGVAGLMMGMSFGLFWANRDFLALSTTNDVNRNYYYGLETFFYTNTYVVVPIAIWAASLLWLRQLSRYERGSRFIVRDRMSEVTS